MADAYELLLEQGAKLRTMELEQWADAGTPESLLSTNARLLSVGYSSEDALERGFSEGFAVIPPVYIHPTAKIETSVLGPYVSIEAGAEITNSVVRDSIIDPGAIIKDCVLDHALIGENAKVTGQKRTLFIGDNASVEL